MLTVSKSNSNHMVYEFRGSVTNYFTTLVNVTFDGGKTWTDTGLKAKYEESSTYYSSLQSITDPNVLFAQEYYFKDKGYTWQEMNGCVVDRETYSWGGIERIYKCITTKKK